MSPELDKLLIELITGFIYGAAAGGVICIVIAVVLFWHNIKDWRR